MISTPLCRRGFYRERQHAGASKCNIQSRDVNNKEVVGVDFRDREFGETGIKQDSSEIRV
jgi:hypothetical protein